MFELGESAMGKKERGRGRKDTKAPAFACKGGRGALLLEEEGGFGNCQKLTAKVTFVSPKVRLSVRILVCISVCISVDSVCFLY